MNWSKGKAKGSPRDRPEKAGNRRSVRFFFVALAVCLALGLGLVALRENPKSLFDRASAALERDPATAEVLLQRSIDAAGGDFPDAQLALCRLLVRQGRWIEALGCFSLIRNTDLCDRKELTQIAGAADDAGELLLAEMAFDAVYRQGKEREGALRRLIPIRHKLGRQQRVLDDCRELARLAPQDPFPWGAAGRVYGERKDVFSAITSYREALRRTPEAESEIVRRQLVELLIQSRDLESARGEIDRLLAAPHVSNETRIHNAHLLRLENKLQQAITAVDDVLSRDPQSIGALMLRGVIQLDRGDFEGCVDDLKRVVQQQPYNKECHYKLAMAYRELRNDEQADHHLQASQRLVELNSSILSLETRAALEPDSVAICRQLADLYQRLGKPEVAQQWRRRAQSIEAGSPSPP